MGEDLRAAHKTLTDKVMGRPGVSGTAIGRRGGRPCLTVYVSDSKAGKGLPKRVGGFRVVIEKSGTFRRL